MTETTDPVMIETYCPNCTSMDWDYCPASEAWKICQCCGWIELKLCTEQTPPAAEQIEPEAAQDASPD